MYIVQLYNVQCTSTCNKSNNKFYVKKIIYQTLKIVVATAIFSCHFTPPMEWFYFEQQVSSFKFTVDTRIQSNLGEEMWYVCLSSTEKRTCAIDSARGRHDSHVIFLYFSFRWNIFSDSLTEVRHRYDSIQKSSYEIYFTIWHSQ